MKRGKQQIPMGCGDEGSMLSRWRHVSLAKYNYTGLVKQMQRKYNKRARKLAKQELEYEDGG